jgi:hypothetical protein
MRELWEADLRATASQRAFPFRSCTSVKGAFSIVVSSLGSLRLATNAGLFRVMESNETKKLLDNNALVDQRAGTRQQNVFPRCMHVPLLRSISQ